ncbi:hypothetical protein L3V82_10275 [Thiotrichales bacterium 19S3-7]|nr:hypothetical protein [Thiotrichales bacterium 19S3-7]MCF6802542.1 hypothetical protein [Thiotrichales bacterium 19S3-11]
MWWLTFAVNIVTIFAALCAIRLYFKWGQEVTLSRKLKIYEEFYLKYIEVYDILIDLYKPNLSLMRTTDINIDDDPSLKERIHKFRREVLRKNIKTYSEFRGHKNVMQIYFDRDSYINLYDKFEEFSGLYLNLLGSVGFDLNNIPEHFRNYIILDDDFLKIFRRHCRHDFSMPSNTYSNDILRNINDIKEEFNNELKKLLKQSWQGKLFNLMKSKMTCSGK